MFELLITKSTLYAKKRGVAAAISGIKEVNDLDEGAIAVFTDSQELVTAANASTIFENRSRFFIAVGGDQNTLPGVQISEMIDRGQIISYFKRAYVAPAKQAIVCGVGVTQTNDGIGTIVAGDYAYMAITDTTSGIIPPETIERYTYKVKAGDTADNIFMSFAAQINAKVGGLGTAVLNGTDDGFVYTVAEFGKTVEITFDGVASDVPVDYSVTANGAIVINYGSGTPSHVASIEEEFSPILGNTNKLSQPALWYKRVSKVDSAATYILYTLSHQGIKQGAISQQSTVRKTLIIAIPTGATQIAAFDTCMTAALAEQNAVFNGIES